MLNKAYFYIDEHLYPKTERKNYRRINRALLIPLRKLKYNRLATMQYPILS